MLCTRRLLRCCQTLTALVGAGIVVCPGGGYFMLAVDHEGLDVASWLADKGIAAFILKYRVMETPRSDEEMMAYLAPSAPAPGEEGGSSSSGQAPGMLSEILRRMNEFAPIPLADGGEAMRLVQNRAEDWGLETDRIGAVGFSAGGRLVLDLAMSEDPAVRPAFVGAIYPAYPGHAVPGDAPPLFLAVAVDDPLLPGSIQAMEAWREAGRPVEAHFYGRGGHGFGLHEQGVPADGWIGQFHQWIGSEGFLG